MYCKSQGLRLAKLPSDIYDKVVSKLQDDSVFQNSKVAFDATVDLHYRFLESPCAAIDTNETGSEIMPTKISCTEESYKFLCEVDYELETSNVEIDFLAEDNFRFMYQIGEFDFIAFNATILHYFILLL
jgi:hypothetical protein